MSRVKRSVKFFLFVLIAFAVFLKVMEILIITGNGTGSNRIFLHLITAGSCPAYCLTGLASP